MDWIKNIGDAIEKTFKGVRKPVTSIPPILLLCEIMNRPGLSAITLTSSIVNELYKNNFPTETTDCGLDNMNNLFIKICAEETVKHIKTYGKSESVIPMMGMSFFGTGANEGGPVTLTLYNNNNAEYGGIPR